MLEYSKTHFIYCNKTENFGDFQAEISRFFFYVRKLEISEVSEFLILALILKSKTRKTQKYFQDLEISKNGLYLGKLGISKVSDFLILAPILKSKTPKTREFSLTCKVK